MASSGAYQPLLSRPGERGTSSFLASSGFKFVMLGVISLICFGQYFDYDSIQNFQDQMASDFGYDSDSFNTRFQALYFIYSIPNFVLPFFGGLLGDKIGLRLAANFYCLLVVLGSIIAALGPTLAASKSVSGATGYYVLVLGRFVFGCGAESLNAIQTSMVAVWFSQTQLLSFAMSFAVSVARLGDFLTLGVASTLAEWTGSYRYVYWIGAGLCVLGMLATLVYALLDRMAEPVNRDRVASLPSDDPLRFRAVLGFDGRFWVVAVLCMTYYSGVFPFVSICSTWLKLTYGLSDSLAGWYSSSIPLMSMLLAPLLGKGLDVVKRRPYAIVLGSTMITLAHAALLANEAYVHQFAWWAPLPFIVVVGLSFALVPSALWPCIPLLVNDDETATAFGTMASIQNMGLFLTSFMAGAIKDHTPTYTAVFAFIVLMDLLGLMFGVILIIMDRARGGLLIGTMGKRGASVAINSNDA